MQNYGAIWRMDLLGKLKSKQSLTCSTGRALSTLFKTEEICVSFAWVINNHSF